jgi:hypothetical protein
VRHVKISTGVDSQTQRLVYELWIDLSFHGVVKLFTGHDLPELNAVVDAIRKHLPEEPPGSNTEGSTPDRPAGPIEVDYEERDTR